MNLKYSDVFKYVMVIGVIAVIAWLFPRNVHTEYKFELGDRWRYADLVAPFDFSIKKSPAELELERQEIADELYPFYLLDEEIAINQVKKFESRFLKEVQNLSSTSGTHPFVTRRDYYADLGMNVLRRMFSEGVIAENTPVAERDYINLLRDESPRIIRVGQLQNVDEAQIAVADTLRSLRLKEGDMLTTLVQSSIVPNIRYDEDLTERYKTDAYERININKGAVLKGDLIVGKSDLITRDVHDKITSYEQQYSSQVGNQARHWTVFAGYLILTSLIIGVFLLYIQFHANEIFQKWSSLAFMLMWPVLFSFLITAVEQTPNMSAYMIPFCVVPIVMKNFYSDRLAMFTHIVIILISSFLSKEGYEFTFLQILAGIVTVLTVKETRYWNKFFASIFFIFMTYILGYIGLDMIVTGSLEEMHWKPLIYFVISGVLTLLAYPMIPLLEGIFGFTSSIKLAELSDMNRPLLRDLSVKAPGTFQHSLQVANLSEAAAEAIGANGLLVKTAALYHDIGKMEDPLYFIENQRDENPHDQLSDVESAKKIIAHVSDGVRMAKKAKLPAILISFIETHHGTTRTEYFYRNFLKEHPDEKIDESLFRYPGPLPKTREEALLMLADSIEAASKSLKNPTGADIDTLVDNIIKGKIDQNQLDEASISFHDLAIANGVFKKLLRNIYHVRIEYPKEPVESGSD